MNILRLPPLSQLGQPSSAFWLWSATHRRTLSFLHDLVKEHNFIFVEYPEPVILASASEAENFTFIFTKEWRIFALLFGGWRKTSQPFPRSRFVCFYGYLCQPMCERICCFYTSSIRKAVYVSFLCSRHIWSNTI